MCVENESHFGAQIKKQKGEWKIMALKVPFSKASVASAGMQSAHINCLDEQKIYCNIAIIFDFLTTHGMHQSKYWND